MDSRSEKAHGTTVTDNTALPVSWKVGEHVAVVGDTGTGKTYLVSKLTDLRKYVVILRTKPDDIKFPGFRKAQRASALDDLYDTRILLTPKHSHQMREGYALLERVWEQGGWTVVIDELWYTEKLLKLGPLVERILTQGRSKKISVIVGMQRPAQISRFAISQCTHLFSFRVEGRDLQTIKESTSPRVVEPINELTGHNFVYYNRAKRIVATGEANSLGRIIASPRNSNLEGG